MEGRIGIGRRVSTYTRKESYDVRISQPLDMSNERLLSLMPIIEEEQRKGIPQLITETVLQKEYQQHYSGCYKRRIINRQKGSTSGKEETRANREEVTVAKGMKRDAEYNSSEREYNRQS